MFWIGAGRCRHWDKSGLLKKALPRWGSAFRVFGAGASPRKKSGPRRREPLFSTQIPLRLRQTRYTPAARGSVARSTG